MIELHEPPPLGVTLRQLRKHHGMSMGDMAAAIGVNVSVISEIERGRVVIVPALEQRYLLAICERSQRDGGR